MRVFFVSFNNPCSCVNTAYRLLISSEDTFPFWESRIISIFIFSTNWFNPFTPLIEIFNSFNKNDNDFIFHWKDNSSPVLVTLPDKKIDGFNTSKKHVIVPS